MYPSGDLNRGGRCKATLLLRIHRRREESVELFGELARPLGWVDAGMTRWRRLAPWTKMAAAAAGLVLGRRLAPGRVAGRRLLRWAPVAFSLVRLARRHYSSHPKGGPRPATSVQPNPVP